MIQRTKGKIVLYQPHQADPSLGIASSKDMLPLECMSIAAYPEQDGHEIVIIDGSLYSQEEAHQRVLEACDGAMLYGTTGILGYMVKDSFLCSEKVHARYPELKKIIGGWFASVRPDLQLKTGVYDAVVCGQGELAFREIVEAVSCGEPLKDIKSVCTLQDGEVVINERQPVVGWDKLLNMPWHLIDDTIDVYRSHQMRQGSWNDVLRMPTPHWIGDRKPYFGITYFSSFGCPEPCKFCCSPFVTNRRWKSMPADRMLDDLQDLKERWDFDVVRFHDANFGVMQKRVKEFSEGILERDLKFGWNAFIETHAITSYEERTLDAMAESGMYVAEIGAETGTEEFMKEWIGKPIKGDDNVVATKKMGDRGIESSVTYVIGFPHESDENMLATIDQARRCQLISPQSSPTVFPYRPIPGTPMWDEALKLGFEPPEGLLDWGSLGEYHLQETWKGRIPPHVARIHNLYCHYRTLARGYTCKKGGMWDKLARWRLKTGNYKLGHIDAKIWSVQNRIMKKLAPQKRVEQTDTWYAPAPPTTHEPSSAAPNS